MTIPFATIPFARFTVGLLQGLALVVLLQAAQQQVWPATDPLVFAPVLVALFFVPAIVISGLGNLRPRTLAVWAIAATALCVGLALHDAVHADSTGRGMFGTYRAPSRALWSSLAAILFMIHSLVVSTEADKRWLASYPTHVDTSWKLGVQLVLAVGFVGVLWAVLYLSAELFRLINIRAVRDVISTPRFAVPVTALAFAAAIHVTDVHANIVQGVRNLGLVLLSWLLPLMAGITATFLVALFFTGLEPLWNTRSATSILLTAAAILVFLINTAYRDGRPETRPGALLRIANAVAVVALLPIISLTGYALALRVQQYGWTPDRVIAAACVAVAVCYGLGYIAALARSGPALRGLESTNLATAFVIILAVICLRSPIADPARLSVADQLRRLDSGRTAPTAFDYAFLRFNAGRYGEAALAELAARTSGSNASTIAELARQAQNAKSRYAKLQPTTTITPEQRSRNIKVVFPTGGSLPENFLQHDWRANPQSNVLPHCLTREQTCDAIVADLDDDGTPEVLLTRSPSNGMDALKATSDGGWSVFRGNVTGAVCPGVREGMRTGDVAIVQPRFKEIAVGGQRLAIATHCADVSPKPN